MRTRHAALLGIGVTLAAGRAGAQASGKYPAVTIPNTEVRSLRSTITGRDYDLYLYLPASMMPGSKYPVLYLLDGQWDFKLLASIQGGLLYDQWVPDVIVVGITYTGARANYDSLRAAKLYVEVGDQESLYGPVSDLVKTLRARGYKSLVMESRVVAGERHSGNKPEGFNRGLRFLFQLPQK